MDGPFHYREAEQHLDFAKGEVSDALWHQRQAQVHATLALAAATAIPSTHRTQDETSGWASAVLA